MSHLNPRQPNIYQDKLAASRGIDLRDKNKFVHVTAKRSLIPSKDYRHCADAQVIEFPSEASVGWSITPTNPIFP